MNLVGSIRILHRQILPINEPKKVHSQNNELNQESKFDMREYV